MAGEYQKRENFAAKFWCTVLRMRNVLCIAFLAMSAFSLHAIAENMVGRVKKAVDRSTLNQPGTKPFHLKATVSPSFERDKGSGRTAEVEIWWVSPTQWRHEIRSTDFHQIEIVNNNLDWQKNEGDYFPEWLRETAVQLINPLPSLNEVLEHVKTAESRNLFGQQTNIEWTATTGTSEVHNIQRFAVALQPSTGLMLYTYGFGWGAEFKDYQDFHGRKVARTVNVGSPQVTARIKTLEDLGNVPTGFFNADAKGGDPKLGTEVIDEPTLRKNLLPMEPVSWPTIQDGSLKGNVTSWIVVDRHGNVREIDGIVSENSAVNETGKEAIMKMHFTPFLVNGTPTQVLSQFTLPFKTGRPANTEAFDSAHNYFERGRKMSFPVGQGAPYVVRAEFQFVRNGATATGQYEDTWLSDKEWLRKAAFEKDECTRSRDDEKTYRVINGSSAGVLCLVLRAIEPIPAIDTFVESDWRIRRGVFDGAPVVRISTGHADAGGKPDAQSREYWFDNSALLLKAYFNGLEIRRTDFQEFSGLKIARQINVLKDGQLGLKIHIIEISPGAGLTAHGFKLKGHEWQRMFTDEAR
jgi:hypothetical protein